MAELLTKIPTSVTEYPKSFKRQGCFPLEAYSVFYATADKTAFEAAQDYAARNAIAYVGQTLAVVTTKASDATIVEDVTFYIIADADGTLQEVGKATNGDGNTITLDEGVLSLKGFDAAPNATLPQKAPVYKKDDEGNDTEVVDHYELRWVAIDAIVEGDTNTKTVVAAGDNETHVLVELARDDSTDTNTYKISLDLSAYATNTDVENGIKTAKEELEGAIGAVEERFETAIGVASAPAEGEEGSEGYKPAVEATGLFAAIEEAEARAKAYADANDADTIYNDTEVRDLIGGHETRISSIETAIGDETAGLIKNIADNAKAISDEAKARAAADAQVLVDAKAYTDEEVVGLEISIEKKTVNEVESDYIVIKNKLGVEVASVNAAKFVKDGMLDKAEYDKDAKKLTLTWNTDAGKNATEIDLNDLVNTYTGDKGIVISAEGVVSVDANYVALQSDISTLQSTLSAQIDTKRTETQVNDQIDAKLVAVNTEIAKKADAETTNAAIALKADTTALNKAVEDLTTEINAKADAATTQEALNAKLSVADFNNTKSTFAVKTDVDGQFETLGTTISTINEAVETNAQAIADHAAAAEATYATKTELTATDDKAVSNASAIVNLTSRLDGIVAQGGEPNVINNIKVNGVVQTIASDKSVDITVPVISNVKVSELSDGQAVLTDVAGAKANIGTLETAVSGLQGSVSSLSNSLSALDTEVRVNVDARLDALEGAKETLVANVATNTTDISNLKAKDTELAGVIQANTAKFNDYYTKTEADAKYSELSSSIKGDLASYVEKSTFETYQTVVTGELDKKAAIADVNDALMKVDAEVAKKANAAEVYTKTDADAKFMTEAQVKSTVDKVITDAVDSDTLEGLAQLVEYAHANAGNIAKLVKNVEDNSAAIATNASAIEANTTAISANTAAIETLTTSVAANIADITVHSSDEIEVVERTGENETGIELGIKEVDVSKLVQSAGYILVLNGGNATV